MVGSAADSPTSGNKLIMGIIETRRYLHGAVLPVVLLLFPAIPFSETRFHLAVVLSVERCRGAFYR